MPVSKSAKRALRKSEIRRERNLYYLSKMREAIRIFKKKVLDIGNKSNLEASSLEPELRKVISIISHTASKGVIHRNEASRRISRITNFYNKFFLKSDAKQEQQG